MTPFAVDNSALSKFARCEMAGWLRYGQHRATAEAAATLQAGGDTAAALAHLRRGASATEALAVYDARYQPYAEQHRIPPSDRLSWQNTRTILWQYMSFGWPEQLQRFRIEPELIEVTFEVPLTDEGDIVLTGRTDLGGYWEGDNLVVWDDKTTGSRVNEYWAKKYRLESGQSGYVWALRQKGWNVLGTVINGIEYSALPSDPRRKCSTHKVAYEECGPRHAKWQLFGPYPREAGFLEEWRADAIALAREYRRYVQEVAPALEDVHQVPMRGQFTDGCSHCEYPDFCLAGRSPALIEANTVESKWDPREVS